MTATAARLPRDRGLLAGYLADVTALGLGDRAIRDRLRIAAGFLGRLPDLQAWMALPATERITELHRTGAWPLLCYAIGTGQLRLDLELAGAKQLTGLARIVEARDPQAFAAARAQDWHWAGSRHGWRPCSASASR